MFRQPPTTTYSATDVEDGIGSPSSFRPSIWRRIASYMFASASSRVAPVATHPGRSGEYAEKFCPAFSTTIRKRYMFMCRVRSASEYCESLRRQIVTEFAGDGHSSRFPRMLE